jgi:hypothetical protein
MAKHNLSATLSGVVALALDADLPRHYVADELRRFAELVHPAPRRAPTHPRPSGEPIFDPALESPCWDNAAADRRMSIDPSLDVPIEQTPSGSPATEPDR